MRPLHSLLVLVSLLLLGAGGWFLLRTADPEQRVKAAGPAPAMPVESAGAPAAADLRAPDGERSATRVERPVEGLSAPAAEVASASPATSGERLSGRVLDERGAPLAKARVLVAVGNLPFFADMPIDSLLGSSWIKLEEAETDAQGRFVFEGVEPGAHAAVGVSLADVHGRFTPASATR